jgi:signal transduction histidine kinase
LIIAILLGLYLSSLYSYLLFHSVVEVFGILIAFSIFLIAWNSQRFLDNNYLLFIGIAYLFVGFIGLLHTLAYKGMGVFHGYDADLPTQLWISARYVQSFSLFVAPLFLGKKLKVNLILGGYTAITVLLLGTIFYWGVFPVCFIEGVGLTPFKKVSEYVICLILVASLVWLNQKRKEFDPNVLRLLFLSLLISIASELAFTFYIDVYGFSNLVGHFFMVASFYLVYKALIETGLRKPYNLLFRNLKQSEEELRRAKDDLEIKVTERTRELRNANEQLQIELAERQRAEEALRESEGRLRYLSSQLLLAQENERKRIAGEIHDGLGQLLHIIKSRAENLFGRMNKSKESGVVEDLIPVIQESIQEARRIQMDLRPSILDDLGILATLSWFFREFQKTYSNIRIEKEIDIKEDEVAAPLKTVIYRIFQEALNNIAKHSKADHVHLSLRKTDGMVELIIRDNGQGFVLEEAQSVVSSRRGLGLTSMRERAELSGGSLKIESVKGAGTVICAKWPLNDPESNSHGIPPA